MDLGVRDRLLEGRCGECCGDSGEARDWSSLEDWRSLALMSQLQVAVTSLRSSTQESRNSTWEFTGSWRSPETPKRRKPQGLPLTPQKRLLKPCTQALRVEQSGETRGQPLSSHCSENPPKTYVPLMDRATKFAEAKRKKKEEGRGRREGTQEERWAPRLSRRD
nr:uncharacterized protein LOC109155047 [Ipomoea batatas]